jgi:energy-converting hydrogenase Eha subunit A
MKLFTRGCTATCDTSVSCDYCIKRNRFSTASDSFAFLRTVTDLAPDISVPKEQPEHEKYWLNPQERKFKHSKRSKRIMLAKVMATIFTIILVFSTFLFIVINLPIIPDSGEIVFTWQQNLSFVLVVLNAGIFYEYIGYKIIQKIWRSK